MSTEARERADNIILAIAVAPVEIGRPLLIDIIIQVTGVTCSESITPDVPGHNDISLGYTELVVRVGTGAPAVIHADEHRIALVLKPLDQLGGDAHIRIVGRRCETYAV